MKGCKEAEVGQNGDDDGNGKRNDEWSGELKARTYLEDHKTTCEVIFLF